jgi:hypothetical protein
MKEMDSFTEGALLFLFLIKSGENVAQILMKIPMTTKINFHPYKSPSLTVYVHVNSLYMSTMDQISIKTSNPKCRLFSKIDQ